MANRSHAPLSEHTIKPVYIIRQTETAGHLNNLNFKINIKRNHVSKLKSKISLSVNNPSLWMTNIMLTL